MRRFLIAGVPAILITVTLILVLVFTLRNEAEPPLSLSSLAPSVAPRTNYTVGVYYYPWYGDGKFHNGQEYTRRDLKPPQRPELGEYNSRDPSIISQHVAWSRYAGINLWVTSWWGPGTPEDDTTRTAIFNHTDIRRKNLRIALLYETLGRVTQNSAEPSSEIHLNQVQSDIEYIATTYFDHSNYFCIQGKPVLFVYLTRWLYEQGKLKTIITLMRRGAASRGYDDIFIIGDQVWNDAPLNPLLYDPFQWLDGVTNYDVYGNLFRPDNSTSTYATQARVDDYDVRQKHWSQACQQTNHTFFIPCITPGFNNNGLNTPLPRQLDADQPFGSLFQALLEKALPLVEDEAERLCMITSWNEFHEDTQIEPVAVANITHLPLDVTHGNNYQGYGRLYLDLLRQATGAFSEL